MKVTEDRPQNTQGEGAPQRSEGGSQDRRPGGYGRDRRPEGGPQDRRPRGRSRGRFPRRKVCPFCAQKIEYLDYKDVVMLRRFVTDRGKILHRRITGTCSKHQRQLTTAIKRARNIALLAYKNM